MRKLVYAAALTLLAPSLFAQAPWAAAGAPPAVAAPAAPAPVTNFGTKAPVIFDHGRHARPELTCATCHHTAAEGKYRCGECHGLEAAGQTPGIKDAMHGKDKGVCYACHLQKDAAHKVKCSDCHKG